MITFNKYVNKYVLECDLRYCYILSPFFDNPDELPGLWLAHDTEEGMKFFCCGLHKERWIEDKGVHV
ncbi:MAG: hypothetical protein ACXABY_08780 [Candidatus Thorarchaeota archaeon]